jgi:phosphoglycolate phosphatase-like HAD superfamily hydrolase
MPLKINKTARIRLALFDIDGTLITGSDQLAVQATETAIASFMGFCGSPDEIEHSGFTDLRTFTELGVTRGLTPGEARARAEIALIHKDALYGLLVSQQVILEPLVSCRGADEFISELLRRGVRLGIFTGNTPLITRYKIIRAGLNPSDFTIFGYGHQHLDKIEVLKILIDQAKKFLPALQPSEILVVGDTPTDIEAAYNVGAWAHKQSVPISVLGRFF